MSAGLGKLSRFYNGVDHFYTLDPKEPGIVPGKYASEGIACLISTKNGAGLAPLYRYYNRRDHFYTLNASEIGTTTSGAVGKYGYKSEGIAGYCLPSKAIGSIPLYRYYNGVDHFYTTNAQEIGTTTVGAVGKYNYRSEGIACYVWSF